MTIVARYTIDPAALEDVGSSVELADALREHLRGEFAMPLDEPLQIDLRGEVTDPVHGGSYFFAYSDLATRVEGGASAAGPLRALIRHAHGPDSAFDDDDWDEGAAWGELLDAIESGLTRSLAAMNTDFQAEADGHVPLRVAAVHVIPSENRELEEDLQRLFIQIDPSARFGSSALSDWEPPEGLTYEIESVLIELEPIPVETEQPAIEAAEVSVEELDRLVGEYEHPELGGLHVTREGEELYAQPDDPNEEALPLIPLSPTEFVPGGGGGGPQPTLVFAIGADGTAESVTISQGGMSIEFTRRP
ncbi:MAG: hypothetical protein R3266_09405 [Gemmatimonadota bacterium]|nr:hypothetical protein [Gemmatimonadota bacterium]